MGILKLGIPSDEFNFPDEHVTVHLCGRFIEAILIFDRKTKKLVSFESSKFTTGMTKNVFAIGKTFLQIKKDVNVLLKRRSFHHLHCPVEIEEKMKELYSLISASENRIDFLFKNIDELKKTKTLSKLYVSDDDKLKIKANEKEISEKRYLIKNAEFEIKYLNDKIDNLEY